VRQFVASKEEDYENYRKTENDVEFSVQITLKIKFQFKIFKRKIICWVLLYIVDALVVTEN
jgi:hypothetical protein